MGQGWQLLGKTIIEGDVRVTKRGRAKLDDRLRELAARDPQGLARMVVESARLAGGYASTAQFARVSLEVNPRTLRKWLSGASRVPPAMVDRFVAIGLEVGSSLIWSAVEPVPLASAAAEAE